MKYASDASFGRQDDISEDDDSGYGEGGGFQGGNEDSEAPDQSISHVPPAPPQQQLQPQPVIPQPRALAAFPPIAAHLSNLATNLASRTADGFLNDFKQSWGSRLPGPGAGVPSVRPGGHMQRESLKRKAEHISRSAAELHSFACVEDLSERAGNRLLTFSTNASPFVLRNLLTLMVFCVFIHFLRITHILTLFKTLSVHTFDLIFVVAECLRSIVGSI